MNAIDQLKKKIIEQTDPKVIGLCGDPAFVDESLEFLRRRILSTDESFTNHHRLAAGENDLSELTTSLYSMPFLAKSRLFELRAAEKLNAEEHALIMGYLERPCPSSWLVIIFDKIDKKNKLISFLDSCELLYTFETKSLDYISLIIEEAKALGLVLDHNVAQFLDAAVGRDLLLLRASLNKLSLLFRDQKISIDDVENHIVDSGDCDVFMLVRAISEGILDESLYMLALLRNQKESAIKFLGILMWQFRTLLHIRYCLDQGMPEWDIRKQIGVFGDRFLWMAKIARMRTIAFHSARLTKLLECDRALKTESTKEPFNFIERVVYQSVVGF